LIANVFGVIGDNLINMGVLASRENELCARK
jgi:hypothetical protein